MDILQADSYQVEVEQQNLDRSHIALKMALICNVEPGINGSIHLPGDPAFRFLSCALITFGTQQSASYRISI